MTVPPNDHPTHYVGAVSDSQFFSHRALYISQVRAEKCRSGYDFGAFRLETRYSHPFGQEHRWGRLDRMLSGDIGVFPWEADPHTKMVEGDL